MVEATIWIIIRWNHYFGSHSNWQSDRVFQPMMEDAQRELPYAGCGAAVKRVQS